MARKITYWVCTALVAAQAFLAAFIYLSGSPQTVQGFAHLGYPQQLRIILGIAKPLGAIALLGPGMVRVKEWAYAGFAIAWICATVAHRLAGDGPSAFGPLVLLVLLVISYLTRPANRQFPVQATQS